MNWRLTIKQETLFRTGGLLLFLVIGGAVMLGILFRAGRTVEQVMVEKANSLSALSEFKEMVILGQKSSIAWVYQPQDREAKAELRGILQQETASLKLRLTTVAATWPDTNQVRSLKSSLIYLDTLLGHQKKLTQLLANERSYANERSLAEAKTLLAEQVQPTAQRLLALVSRLNGEKFAEFNQVRQELAANLANTRVYLIITILILVVPALILTWGFANAMTQSLGQISSNLGQMALGQLPPPIKRTRADELGDIGELLNQVNESFAKTANFARQIGQGNYEAEHHSLSEQDQLGNALVQMRDRLRTVAEEDRRRNWANEGAAKFADLMRTANDSSAKLAARLISELVNYIGANQGNFFILNDERPDEVHMELVAAYAWHKHRFAQSKVFLGEGAVGQAWIERDTIYLTDVPDSYTYIGSGLGDANPRCIVIVPLIFNEQVYGVLEVASFKVLETYKLDLLKRLGASIASAIATGKGNDRTQQLLATSQEMAEQLRMQEEEMRQNLEELMATQDELQRKVASYEREVQEHRDTIERLQPRKRAYA
jgi:putative methionine-R-sulfoxide reductase with GAF domain